MTRQKKGRDRSRPFVFVDRRACLAKTRFALLAGHDDVDKTYFASARFGGVAGHDMSRVSESTGSPLRFSFASLRWGAMVPSFWTLANQCSAVSFLFSFGPQAPCTPDFSRRSSTESWAAANASIAACGVVLPDDASPIFCHHSCASFG